MTGPEEVAAVALSIVDRLRVAELSCRDRYVNPHRESASLPVVRELAETLAALAVLVAELTAEETA